MAAEKTIGREFTTTEKKLKKITTEDTFQEIHGRPGQVAKIEDQHLYRGGRRGAQRKNQRTITVD